MAINYADLVISDIRHRYESGLPLIPLDQNATRKLQEAYTATLDAAMTIKAKMLDEACNSVLCVCGHRMEDHAEGICNWSMCDCGCSESAAVAGSGE